VSAVSLDSLFPQERPDLVKIDVEEAEYRVIEGARNLISQGHTKFLIEVHPWGDENYGKRPSDVFRFFNRHGYHFRRTHRHWLFEKSSHSKWWNRISSALVGFILDHYQLKRAVKGVILKFGGSSRR